MQKWWNRFKIIFNFKKSIPLVYNLLRDTRVPKANKTFFLVVSIGYFILPFDFIVDYIPVLGYLDDVGVVLFLMERFINSAPPEVVGEYLRR